MKIFSLLDTQYRKFESSVKSYLSRILPTQGQQYGNGTVFGQLISVVGNAIQNIMLYIEDSLVEQNKYTAQRKKSIYGLASLSGYQPSYGKASSVQLKISFIPNNETINDILIKNKEVITCTQNGLKYNIILPQEVITMSIEKDNSNKIVYAVQGSFESQSFISTGGKYYTQNIRFLGNLDTDYLSVYVNDEKWEYKDSLYDMGPDSKTFTYKVSIVNGLDIIFGNDMYGRSVKEGDVIKIEYLVHDGEVGNLNSISDTYFIFDNDLYNTMGENVDGNSIFNISFANNDPIIGGTNSENLDQVRHMIGLNSRSLVLATPENYKNLINKFSFCGYNRTWSEPGSLHINSMILKNFKKNMMSGTDYFNLKENDFLLTEAQKNSIINYINNSGNQLGGSTYNVINPHIRKYSAYLYITLKNNKYDKEYIKNKIRCLIGDFFSEVNNDKFIAKSDIIYLLKSNIDSIDGVTLYFLSEQNESAIITGSYSSTKYVYNPVLGTYDKVVKNIKVYPGENPNIGLDNHGNILLTGDNEYPALMGGWNFKSNKNGQLVNVIDPLIINFE